MGIGSIPVATLTLGAMGIDVAAGQGLSISCGGVFGGEPDVERGGGWFSQWAGNPVAQSLYADADGWRGGEFRIIERGGEHHDCGQQ